MALRHLLFALARGARACTVCFGQGENPDLPRAFTWGVVLLVAVTFLVLGGFVATVIRVESGRADLD